MFKAQTDIGVSDKLQLFLRKTQFLLDNKNAWALGLYEKTPSCLRGKHGRHCSRCVRFWLTLNLCLIAHKIHSKLNTVKLSLVLLFFCFQLRPSNPLGLRGNCRNCCQVLTFQTLTPSRKYTSLKTEINSTQHKVKTIFCTWNHKQNKYKFSFTLKFANPKRIFWPRQSLIKKSCIRFQTYSKLWLQRFKVGWKIITFTASSIVFAHRWNVFWALFRATPPLKVVSLRI